MAEQQLLLSSFLEADREVVPVWPAKRNANRPTESSLLFVDRGKVARKEKILNIFHVSF